MEETIVRQAGIQLNEETDYIDIEEFDSLAFLDFKTKFLRQESDPHRSAIIINISSYGGDMSALIGMLDLVNNSKKDVYTIASGSVLSAGACFLIGSQKGKRIVSPLTHIMLHPLQTGAMGDIDKIKGYADYSKKREGGFFEYILRNSNLTYESYQSILKENNMEWWMTPEEALEYELVDYIGTVHLETETTTKLTLQ
jgi:ATP-dependent protease ClpP protease subunit